MSEVVARFTRLNKAAFASTVSSVEVLAMMWTGQGNPAARAAASSILRKTKWNRIGYSLMPLTEGVTNSFSFCVNVWAIVLTATLVKFLDVLTRFTVAVHVVHPLVGNNFRHNLEIGLCFYGFDFEYILKIGLVEPGHFRLLQDL